MIHVRTNLLTSVCITGLVMITVCGSALYSQTAEQDSIAIMKDLDGRVAFLVVSAGIPVGKELNGGDRYYVTLGIRFHLWNFLGLQLERSRWSARFNKQSWSARDEYHHNWNTSLILMAKWMDNRYAFAIFAGIGSSEIGSERNGTGHTASTLGIEGGFRVMRTHYLVFTLKYQPSFEINFGGPNTTSLHPWLVGVTALL